MRRLEHLGDLLRVHDVRVRDTDGGAGVGGRGGRVGREAEGFQRRGDVGVLEPFSRVGYAFEVEEEPGCIERQSAVSFSDLSPFEVRDVGGGLSRTLPGVQ